MDAELTNEKTRSLPVDETPARENSCPYCDASLQLDDKYCAVCGYEVGSLQPEAGAAAMPQAGLVEATIDGQTYRLTEGEHVLGRSEGDLIVSNPYLSRRHLALTVRGRKLFVRDLGSTNGTFADGERLQPETERELLPGMALKAGEVTIGLRWLSVPASSGQAGDAPAAAAEALEAPALEPAAIDVAEVSSPWMLDVAGTVYPLGFGQIRVGRKADRNDLAFPQDGYMSASHFLLDVDLDSLKVQDLSSTNGTLVRGERIAAGAWVELGEGDTLQAGQMEFTVRRSALPQEARGDSPEAAAEEAAGEADADETAAAGTEGPG